MKLTYYLEKLRNIKSLLIVVYFKGEEGDLVSSEDDIGLFIHFDVRATHHLVKIRVLEKSNEKLLKSLDIPLPHHCKIDPTSLHCQQDPKNTYEDAYIEIKARIIIDSSNFDYEASENDVLNDHHLISVDTTERMKIHLTNNTTSNNSIYCRCCQNKLVKFNNRDENIKVKLLPSSNWIELMDVWLCGCTGVTSFVDLPTGEINSAVDHFFIGDQFILLHKENIEIDRINVDSINQPVNIGTDHWNLWSFIHCKYCDNTLGLYQLHDVFNYNYRLFKHQISTTSHPPQSYTNFTLSNTNNLYNQYSLETYFSTKILIESRASVNYKFFLTCTTNNQVFALISLIHWETLLLTNHYNNINNNHNSNTNNNNNDNEFNPILKILYLPINSNSFKDIQLKSKWEKDFQCSNLYFQPDECKTILNILESSNSMFPTHRKNLNIQTTEFKLAVLRLKL